MRTSLHHLLEDRARSAGDSPALTYKDVTRSYDELWGRARQLAGALAQVDLEQGDRVAVFLEKRIETVESLFGISTAGGVLVPINPLLRPAQVGYILRDCDVRVLITTSERLALLTAVLDESPAVRHVIVVGDEAPIDGEVGRRALAWVDVVDAAPELEPRRSIDLDMAAILYTSGSTGMPKGVVLSHRNLVAAKASADYLGNVADDVILAALPLSFDAGFSQLTTAFNVGAHVILMNYLLPPTLSVSARDMA